MQALVYHKTDVHDVLVPIMKTPVIVNCVSSELCGADAILYLAVR